MASPIIWPAGLGGTGVDAATLSPSYFSAAAIFLNSSGGSDSNAGTEPELPKATLASAVSVVAANGVIAVASGHAETIASTVTIAVAGVRVLGFGTGVSRPRFTCNTSTTDMLAVSAGQVVFQNLYFPTAAQSTTGLKVNLSQPGCKVLDSFFECSANATVGDVAVATNNARLENCTFAATGTRPAIGVAVTGTGAGNNFVNLTFDGGTLGWTDYALKVSGANTSMVFQGISLIGKSDIGFTVTGTSYQIFGVPTTGQGRVLLTA